MGVRSQLGAEPAWVRVYFGSKRWQACCCIGLLGPPPKPTWTWGWLRLSIEAVRVERLESGPACHRAVGA
eukprot:6503843-Alexandrium_andersonii.AAC.1